MFVILEKIAQVEPKYVDIVLLENYAAFQHRFIFSLSHGTLLVCAFVRLSATGLWHLQPYNDAYILHA